MVRSPYLDWAVASAPLEGEPESGDLHLVKGISTGLLLAVVDGLGHGVEAAAVARRAVETLAASTTEAVTAPCLPRSARGAVGGVGGVGLAGGDGLAMWIGLAAAGGPGGRGPPSPPGKPPRVPIREC